MASTRKDNEFNATTTKTSQVGVFAKPIEEKSTKLESIKIGFYGPYLALLVELCKEKNDHRKELDGLIIFEKYQQSLKENSYYANAMHNKIIEVFKTVMKEHPAYKELRIDNTTAISKDSKYPIHEKLDIALSSVDDLINELNKQHDKYPFLHGLAVILKNENIDLKFSSVIDYQTPLQKLYKEYSKKLLGGHKNDIADLIKIENKTPSKLNEEIKAAFLMGMVKSSDFKNMKESGNGELQDFIHLMNENSKDHSYLRALAVMLKDANVNGFESVKTKDEIIAGKENAPRNR
jgi:hypothetical protein